MRETNIIITLKQSLMNAKLLKIKSFMTIIAIALFAVMFIGCSGDDVEYNITEWYKGPDNNGWYTYINAKNNFYGEVVEINDNKITMILKNQPKGCRVFTDPLPFNISDDECIDTILITFNTKESPKTSSKSFSVGDNIYFKLLKSKYTPPEGNRTWDIQKWDFAFYAIIEITN